MILLLGLDGLSLEQLNDVMSRTELPNFRKLMSDGHALSMKSTYPYVTAPAWASMFTGVNPGKHGIFEMFHVAENRMVPANYATARTPFIWDYVSWAGKKILVMGVPFTYPAPTVNGVFVTGRFVPALSTYPRGLSGQVDLSAYRYDAEISSSFREAVERTGNAIGNVLEKGPRRAAKEMLSGFKERTTASLKMLREGKWDVVILVDNLPDEILHICYGDTELIDQMFREFDEYLGRLVTLLSEDDTILVVSDHGFGDVEGVLYLNEWFRSDGLLNVRETTLSRFLSVLGLDPNSLSASPIGSRLVRDVLKSRRLRALVESLFTRNFVVNSYDEESKPVRVLNINEPVAWVHVRTQGKSANLVESVTRSLAKLRQQGELKMVAKSRELFEGREVPRAPGQILVECRDGWIIDSGGLQAGKHIGKPHFWKKGAHRLHGVLIFRGPHSLRDTVTASIYDILPTLLNLLRLPVPTYVDGVSLLAGEANVWALNVPERP